MVSGANLFSILTGGTFGLLGDLGSKQAKSVLVKETSKGKLLNMSKS